MNTLLQFLVGADKFIDDPARFFSLEGSFTVLSRRMDWPIKTSKSRNYETIYSGFGCVFAILGPPFPNPNGGPIQKGRLNESATKNTTQ